MSAQDNTPELLVEEQRQIVEEYLKRSPLMKPPASEKTDVLRNKIKAQLKANDAVLIAHYYTDPMIQELAEETGGTVSDSLEMARFGNTHDAQTLVVAGVKFMGETAKILTPHKRLLMPTLEATCSLDIGCPADEFAAFCDLHPDRSRLCKYFCCSKGPCRLGCHIKHCT